MDSQYRLINECLQVLRRCNMDAMKKLRLEVQLFQIKLLLLSDSVSGDIKARYCSEAVLQDTHHQMMGLLSGEDSGAAIEAISQHLKRTAIDLRGARPLPTEVELPTAKRSVSRDQTPYSSPVRDVC